MRQIPWHPETIADVAALARDALERGGAGEVHELRLTRKQATIVMHALIQLRYTCQQLNRVDAVFADEPEI